MVPVCVISDDSTTYSTLAGLPGYSAMAPASGSYASATMGDLQLQLAAVAAGLPSYTHPPRDPWVGHPAPGTTHCNVLATPELFFL